MRLSAPCCSRFPQARSLRATSPSFRFRSQTPSRSDIIAGADGNLWFTEFQTPAIGRITPAGTLRRFTYSPVNSGPTRLAVAQDGNVWFGDRTLHRVGRIKPLGASASSTRPPRRRSRTASRRRSTATSGLPRGVGKIGQLGPGGFGGNPPVITELDAPASNHDIAAGIDGNLWFTEPGNPGKIGRITTGGTVTEFTTGLTPNSSPLRIAAGHDGNLWFTEQRRQPHRADNPGGVINEFPLPAGVNNPVGIAAGPDGNVWFATAQGIGRISPLGSITHYNVPAGRTGSPRAPTATSGSPSYFGDKIGRITTDVVPPTSGNLLLNPGFEQGTPISSNVVSGPTPGWTTVPSFSAAVYGAAGLADMTVGTQVGGGDSFGWGGTMSANIDRSWALQHVDVARETTAIDDGRATVTLSGLLGGLGAQEDNANVRALFLSGSGSELGSAQIGPVTRDERQSQTTLLPRSAAAPLPTGTRAVRVVATSIRVAGGSTNDGFFDNLSLTLDVAPPAPPAATPVPSDPATLPSPAAPLGPGALADATAPVIDRLGASPARFAVAAGSTATAAGKRRTPRGTTLSYGISEPASVTLNFERAVAGRRAGRRCVKANSRNRRAKRCTLYVAAGKLTRSAPIGLSSLKFSGRIGRKALAVGTHRITALASDAAGNQSAGRRVTIKVVKP